MEMLSVQTETERGSSRSSAAQLHAGGGQWEGHQ